MKRGDGGDLNVMWRNAVGETEERKLLLYAWFGFASFSFEAEKHTGHEMGHEVLSLDSHSAYLLGAE